MKLLVTAIACLATLSTTVAAQDASAPTASAQGQSNNSPAAYVYVSSTPNGKNYEINAFSAASNGRLMPISGSPFATNDVSYMALNDKWLFGDNGIDIYSFAIAPNGALKQVSSINAQKYNTYPTGGPVYLFLDRTGETLYDWDIYGDGTGNNDYQLFNINQDDGALTFLGLDQTSAEWLTPLAFIGNNVYAYGSACYLGTPSIYGFSRSQNGTLTDLNINPSIPTAPKPNEDYCPWWAAPDTTDHVAISLTPTEYYSPTGPAQLAVYTADNNGNLTTTSTAQNMPAVSIGSVNEMIASPSGKLLAVSGTKGLQIFHYNGASPITTFTGPLAGENVTQMFWDNDNHLYAVSPSSGKLFVLTVTPTSYSQAPGSPYSITGVQNLIVLPK